MLGPIGYSWILFATALGVAVFGEPLRLATVFGAGLIVAGGIWVAADRGDR